MIVEFLNRLFGASREAPPFSRERVNAMKGINEKDEKYSSDIESLKLLFGAEFKSGLCIELPLKKIMSICPRKRKRVDAYAGLASHLKSEYGVILKITSNKTKI